MHFYRQTFIVEIPCEQCEQPAVSVKRFVTEANLKMACNQLAEVSRRMFNAEGEKKHRLICEGCHADLSVDCNTVGGMTVFSVEP